MKILMKSMNHLIPVMLMACLMGFTHLVMETSTSVMAAGISSRTVSPGPTADTKREKALKYFVKGEHYQSVGLYAEASGQYEKAINIDHSFAEAYSNLGYSYRKQGQFYKAISSYKKAIQLKPELAEAHEYIGEAYAEMGEFEMAEKHLEILKTLKSDEAHELEEFINKSKSQK